MPLPLDTFRAFYGWNPWHFWQFADNGVTNPVVPIVTKCSPLLYEYDWQGSDAAGRSSLRQAVDDATHNLAHYLGYRPSPEYAVETVPWPRHYEADKVRGYDFDATYRRVGVFAPEGYIQAMGVEQLTLINTATVGGGTLVYSALFNPLLEDTFTITLPTTVTDPDEIAVYFAAADRFTGGDFSSAVGDRWRIEPVQVTISGGNVTIVGRKWLVARPILYENPVATMLNPHTAGNFVTSLEVYQRTTNQNGNSTTTAQATLIYETNDCGACWGRCCCSSGTTSSDPGTVGEVIARAGIRDKITGEVTPGAATYDPSSATWSSVWCCNGSYCDPDRVRLRYLAGFPLENGQMAPLMRNIMVRLTAAECKRRILACRETNERLHDMQQDLTLESTQSERYAVPPEALSNPFGFRRGHVEAWLMAQDQLLRRGIHA